MSIGAGLTLVTGPTGGGKSCAVVSWLADVKDRPLFVMGIPDLKIEHQPVPPVEEWTEWRVSPEDPNLRLPYFTFPSGAIVVLDEAQRVYRPRRAGSDVPPHVAAFETRRHTGVDFVLITQHPSLIDANLRKLVTRHIHIHDTFRGRYMLEWVGLGDPDNRASRELATRSKFKPPKRAFDLYKSSELHTKVVRKYPWYFYAVIVLVPVALALIWYSYKRISSRMHPASEPVVEQGVARPVSAASGKIGGQSGPNANGSLRPMTDREYVAFYAPRIEGLPHTAQAYDEVTKPVEAPEPVGCIESKRTGCKCYTQQGTLYATIPEVCKQIMTTGLFMPWKKTEISKRDERQAQSQAQKTDDSPVDRVGFIQHEYQGGTLSETKRSVPLESNDSTNPRYNVSLRGKD